jgi:SAM-dependent methyltransferase
MDLDWNTVKTAKTLAKDQLSQPILKFPTVADYRKPLAEFLKPGMHVLDIGAHQCELRSYLETAVRSSLNYRSMDVDRSFKHDYYSLEEVSGRYNAIACYEVVEHLTPEMVSELFRKAYELLEPGGRLFVSTPNVHHPIGFWCDSTHITPFRLRHLAGWMALAGFKRFWGFRVVQMTWKKRLRYLRYRALLRLLNLDFAPGVLVIGERSE